MYFTFSRLGCPTETGDEARRLLHQKLRVKTYPLISLSLSLSASGTIEGIGFIGSLFRVRKKGDIAFRGERFVHLSISDSDETDAFKE